MGSSFWFKLQQLSAWAGWLAEPTVGNHRWSGREDPSSEKDTGQHQYRVAARALSFTVASKFPTGTLTQHCSEPDCRGACERHSLMCPIKRRESVIMIRDFRSALTTRLSLPPSPPSPAQSQRQNDPYTRSGVHQNAQHTSPVSSLNVRILLNSRIVALKDRARTRLTRFKDR